MLRVHPILHSSDPERMGSLFAALGMEQISPRDGQKIFDAGGGRITVRRAEAALDSTMLGFEVGDLEEFARRTRSSGTAAEVVTGPDGTQRVRVTTSALPLHAQLGERRLHTSPDPALAVVAFWHTPDTTSAVKVLGDIGARARDNATDGASPEPRNPVGHTESARPQDFLAKNGGVAAVRFAPHQYFELGFEYTGELEALCHRVQVNGFRAQLSGAGLAHNLGVELPGGRPLVVTKRRDGAD